MHERSPLHLIRLLLCALALTLAGAAAAEPGVRVTVSRSTGSSWLVDYVFAYKAPVWFFTRSSGDLDGKPWRPQSWTVETPGVRLERIGHHDALVGDGGPLKHVRIRMQPFAEPLTADYAPVLRFSDGGLAIYSDHFTVAPGVSTAAVAALPADLNGASFEQPPVALTLRDPGKRLMLRGAVTLGSARMRLDQGDGYIYSGNGKLAETEAFAGVLDGALPGWVRTELDQFTPRLMALYRRRLGVPEGGRPMALVAWQGAEKPGWSLGGSVLQGMVVMQISGQQVLKAESEVLARMRWFIGHESAHFWLGQTVRYARRSDAWMMEGGADLLAVRAFQELVPDYDGRAQVQRELDECLELSGPGLGLATAEERGAHRASYACGAMLYLAAEARARARGSDLFGFVSDVMARADAGHEVHAADWIDAFGDPALAAELRTYLEHGSAEPRAFWIRLFTATGVRFKPTATGIALD